MKKSIKLLLALLLAIALCLPALASATTITGSDLTTSGVTVLSYSVGMIYYISIPASVNINAETKTGSGIYSVIEGSLIEPGKQLTFAITGATNYGGEPAGFRLVNSADANKYLTYTIKDDATEPNPVVMDGVFLTADATACNVGKGVTLTYTMGTAPAAGTYTDTLTISVAVVDIND